MTGSRLPFFSMPEKVLPLFRGNRLLSDHQAGRVCGVLPLRSGGSHRGAEHRECPRQNIESAVILYPPYIDGRLPYLLEIGDDVVISLYVTILTHDATSVYAADLIKVGSVRIRDHVFIGANSTIMLKDGLAETFGYFCARLPDSYRGPSPLVGGDTKGDEHE